MAQMTQNKSDKINLDLIVLKRSYRISHTQWITFTWNRVIDMCEILDKFLLSLPVCLCEVVWSHFKWYFW